MSDMQFMNRENKKKQLRSNIVSLPRQNAPEPEEEEDSEEIVRRAQRRTWKKRLLLFGAAALAAAAVIFGFFKYQNEYNFSDYNVTWEKSMRYVEEASTEQSGGTGQEGENSADPVVSDSSFVNFVYFGENMLKYTKDGASYIDASGKSIWTESYEMKTPIVSINGDYVAIADQQGNQIYICSTEGRTGIAKTQLPITKVAVSAKGVAAAIVEDSTASYIFYYKKDGEALGIDIKMILSGDGYPVDMALSPDGQQIAMAVSYLENGAMKSKVVFYDFSEIGKNVKNRFIGSFQDEFAGSMAARVRYLNEDTVCVFSDKGISFISVKNVIPDPNLISVPVEETIKSICYSDRYAGVVVDNPSGNPSRLDIYDTNGKQVSSFDFDYPYSGVQIDGDLVILYNEESCMVYNINGHKKFESQFDFNVSCVRGGKRHLNSLIIAGSDKMQEIKLK